MKRAVDVSFWQGLIDWDILSVAVDCVYIRATEGLARDDLLGRNINGSDRTKTPRGFYHAFNWGRSLEEQINNFKITVGGLRQELRPALDLEKYKPPMDPKQVIYSFWDAFPDLVLYTNPSFIKGYLSKLKLPAPPLWIANYGVSWPDIPYPFFKGYPYAWQFAITLGGPFGCVPVNGKTPKIDLDTIFE